MFYDSILADSTVIEAFNKAVNFVKDNFMKNTFMCCCVSHGRAYVHEMGCKCKSRDSCYCKNQKAMEIMLAC